MLTDLLIQLQFLGSALVCVTLVLGIGASTFWFRTLNFKSLSIFCLGALGMLFAGGFALLFNFFFPLTTVFLGVLILWAILGWIKLAPILNIKDARLLAGMTFLYGLLGIRFAPFVDTALYHLPIIHWMHESALPLGLANLHHRFAMWNFWFSLCGGFSAGNILPSAVFALNIVLVAFALGDWIRMIKEEKISSWFALSIFILFAWVDMRYFYGGQKSPNSDFAGSILMLWAFSYFVQQDEAGRWRVPAILLAGLAVLVKLNQAPILFIALFAFLSAIKNRKLKEVLPVCLVVGTAALFMVIKTFWVSGCLIFPAKNACFSVPWRISDEKITDILYWIIRCARRAGETESIALTYFGWLGPWSKEFFQSRIISCLIFPSALYVVLKIIFFRKISFPHVYSLVLILLGLVYWFFSAPDLRFSYSYFAALYALILAPLLQATDSFLKTRFQFQKFSTLLLFGCFASFGIAAIGQVRGAHDFGAGTLKIPTPSHRLVQNGQQQFVYVPEGTDCWALPVPCTPFFEHGVIRVKRNGFDSFEKKL